MKRFAGFMAATIGVCCGGAWIVTLLVQGADVSRAVWMSAAIVVVVQALAFWFVRMMGPLNVIAAWGLGSMLRFASIIAYGFLGIKALGLSMQPALLSMAGFLFVSTVIEPVFLKP